MAADSSLPGVMVVDDEPEALDLVARLFAQAKIRNPLHLFTTGEAAVEYLQRLCAEALGALHDPCLAILDIRMPGMSGNDVLHWIRSQSLLSYLSVVMLSTTADAAEVQRAEALGADAYLLKYPVAETLAGLVRAAQAQPGFTA
jgi:CheY-like chemotaxis protein